MAKDIPFDEEVYCDLCNSKGAYDILGDNICPCCLDNQYSLHENKCNLECDGCYACED